MVLVLVAQLFAAQLLVLLLQVQLSELQFWAQPSTLLFFIFLKGQHSMYFNYYYTTNKKRNQKLIFEPLKDELLINPLVKTGHWSKICRKSLRNYF